MVRRPEWSPEEIELLRQLKAQEETWPAIASHIRGRTAAACQAQWRKLTSSNTENSPVRDGQQLSSELEEPGVGLNQSMIANPRSFASDKAILSNSDMNLTLEDTVSLPDTLPYDTGDRTSRIAQQMPDASAPAGGRTTLPLSAAQDPRVTVPPGTPRQPLLTSFSGSVAALGPISEPDDEEPLSYNTFGMNADGRSFDADSIPVPMEDRERLAALQFLRTKRAGIMKDFDAVNEEISKLKQEIAKPVKKERPWMQYYM